MACLSDIQDDCILKSCNLDICNNDCSYDNTTTYQCATGLCVNDGFICKLIGIATSVPCTVVGCTTNCNDTDCIDYAVTNNCMSDLRLYSVSGLINKYNSSITSLNVYDFTTYIQNSFHTVLNTAENIDNYIPKAEYIRQIDCFSISEDITDEKLVAYKDISLQCVTSAYTPCIPLS